MPADRSATATSAMGVLVSGGLDSCILVGDLLRREHRVQPFYIRTGTTWESQELAALRRFLQAIQQPVLAPLVELHLPLRDVYGDHWSVTGDQVPDSRSPDEAVFLPGRNALLLVKAAVWCQLRGIGRLAWGPLGSSPFPDASREFADQFERVVNLGAPHPVRIELPLAGMRKRQVMELGRGLPLEHTFSCIAPLGETHCGECNKCAERRAAFLDVGFPDPTKYRS